MFIRKEVLEELLNSLNNKELYIEFLSIECVEGENEIHEKCEDFKKKLIENHEKNFLNVLEKHGMIN